MSIYCRGVEIVYLLRIHVFFVHRPRPIDVPQLAWEQSAIKPLSDRYQSITARG